MNKDQNSIEIFFSEYNDSYGVAIELSLFFCLIHPIILNNNYYYTKLLQNKNKTSESCLKTQKRPKLFERN